MPAPNPQVVYEDELQAPSTQIGFQPFGQLTTTEEVRAAFGLSDAELPDEMLTQDIYTMDLSVRLTKLLGSAAPRWNTIVSSNDPADQRILAATKGWVVYAVADKVCDVLPLVVARTLTDSKASFQRFDIDLEAVVANIRKRFAVAEAALIDALDDALTVNLTRVTLLGSGRPTYDPVTGEGGVL